MYSTNGPSFDLLRRQVRRMHALNNQYKRSEDQSKSDGRDSQGAVHVTAITIGKLEAAQRQLRTAITLWFDDGDAVSVHTLAFAAYEIFHAVSEHRDPYRRGLLFDTLLIKDEFRCDWNKLVRREANFFKHGDRDAEAVIDFDPARQRCRAFLH
jgi:hypothetical protein